MLLELSVSGLGKLFRPVFAGILLAVAITGGVSAYRQFGIRHVDFGTPDPGVNGNIDSWIPSGPVAFHTVSFGGYARGYSEPANLVIRNQSELSRVWDKAFCGSIFPCPAIPSVDFEHRTVLAAFLGMKGSGGYSINITQVHSTDSKIIVSILITVPGNNCGVTASFTYPYHMADIPKTEQGVVFEEATTYRDCQALHSPPPRETTPGYFVVNDQETWSKLQMTICGYGYGYHCGRFPEVNFTTSTVLAVFMGMQGNSGYSIKITDVSMTEAGLLVATVRWTEPGPRCMTLQVITYPYDIMVISKTDKSVEFRAVTVVTKC